ncbi:hypothetical protein VTO42DRAFT_174 [Malbranchea cinnamomea]
MESSSRLTITLIPTASSPDPVGPRVLVLGPGHYTAVVGRSSKVESKNLIPARDNGWFDNRVMSRTHAEFTAIPKYQEVYLMDTHSMHGTWVNGVKLTSGRKTLLEQNDVLTFGAMVTRGAETYDPLKVRIELEWSEIKVDKEPAPSKPIRSSNTFVVPDDDDDDDDKLSDVEIVETPIVEIEDTSDDEQGYQEVQARATKEAVNKHEESENLSNEDRDMDKQSEESESDDDSINGGVDADPDVARSEASCDTEDSAPSVAFSVPNEEQSEPSPPTSPQTNETHVPDEGSEKQHFHQPRPWQVPAHLEEQLPMADRVTQRVAQTLSSASLNLESQTCADSTNTSPGDVPEPKEPEDDAIADPNTANKVCKADSGQYVDDPTESRYQTTASVPPAQTTTVSYDAWINRPSSASSPVEPKVGGFLGNGPTDPRTPMNCHFAVPVCKKPARLPSQQNLYSWRSACPTYPSNTPPMPSSYAHGPFTYPAESSQTAGVTVSPVNNMPPTTPTATNVESFSSPSPGANPLYTPASGSICCPPPAGGYSACGFAREDFSTRDEWLKARLDNMIERMKTTQEANEKAVKATSRTLSVSRSDPRAIVQESGDNILKRKRDEPEALTNLKPVEGSVQDPQAASATNVTDSLESKVELTNHTFTREATSEMVVVENDRTEESEERPRKRSKTSHQSSNITKYVATALAGALVGGIGTIMALAALPAGFFE